MSTKPRSSSRAFTLIELIISVGLFMIVVTISMSSFVSLISLNRKARATSDVVTNLSFVIETMSRSIRTGTDYQCGGGTNCWPYGADSFTFTNDAGQTITFIKKSDGTIGECISSACSPTSAESITDSRITIDNLKFYTQGVGVGDGIQPRVVFTITGSIIPDSKSAPVSFSIESSATQRIIDL